MKYRVIKPKAFDKDGSMVPVGHVFDLEEGEEVPGFLVGKVELVPEEPASADETKTESAKAESAKK